MSQYITGQSYAHYALQNNIYGTSLSHALSLSLSIVSLPSPASLYLSSVWLIKNSSLSLRRCKPERQKGFMETVSQTLHDKVSASQDLTPIKTTHPTRDFPFTKALVLGIQGSACQQRHPKYQWKLSCCGIQHSKHQKQGNYCWHKPHLCHKRPLSIRAVSVTENNKRNAWINQPWVELIWISKSSLMAGLIWRTILTSAGRQVKYNYYESLKKNLSVFIAYRLPLKWMVTRFQASERMQESHKKIIQVWFVYKPSEVIW